MTDKEKLDAIRAEIHRLVDVRGYDREMANDLFAFMDSLPNEPVSIWHDSSEIPQEKKVCLIRYSANDGASTNNFEVVIAEPLTRRFVTRSYPHKTGYQHTIHGENTIKVDEYQDRREYIPFSDIDEWAYIDDLLNLSNVERTIKSWKEPDKWEPQTGDTFRKKGTTSPTYHLCDKREDGITFGFVENREVGICGGEITIFALRQDYELVERLKSIEDVVEEEFNRALQTKVEQKTKDESCLKDLGEYINELSKQFPEVSFAKLSRIAVRVAKWQKEKEYTCYEEAFEDGAKWKVENLWKPADGDDLPEIDREVIALLDNGKVVFAHRPNPEGWDAVSIITEKVEHYIPETYGKGGWNIPNVKWWLDCLLPNMEEE